MGSLGKEREVERTECMCVREVEEQRRNEKDGEWKEEGGEREKYNWIQYQIDRPAPRLIQLSIYFYHAPVPGGPKMI